MMKRWHWVSLTLGRSWLFGYVEVLGSHMFSQENFSLCLIDFQAKLSPSHVWQPSLIQRGLWLPSALNKQLSLCSPESHNEVLLLSKETVRGCFLLARIPWSLKIVDLQYPEYLFSNIYTNIIVFNCKVPSASFLSWIMMTSTSRQDVFNDCCNSQPPCAVSQHHLVCLDSIGQKIHLKFSDADSTIPSPVISKPSGFAVTDRLLSLGFVIVTAASTKTISSIFPGSNHSVLQSHV